MFARAAKANALTTRIYAVMPLDQWERLRDAVAAKTYGGADGRGDEWLRVGGLKGFVDGSLGSHTAAFSSRSPTRRTIAGCSSTRPRRSVRVDLRRRQGRPARHGPRDRRSRQSACCSTSSSASASENGARDRRFRIEHAQHLAPADIPRFAQLGVIASMQPYHAIDDGRWAEQFIGRAHRDDLRVPLAARRAARGSRSAATGSSRRRRRSKASTPPSRAARSTTSNPDGWVPAAEDHGRGGAARLHRERRVRLVRGIAQGHARGRQARRPRDARSRPVRHPAGGDPQREGGDDGRRRQSRQRRLARSGASNTTRRITRDLQRNACWQARSPA